MLRGEMGKKQRAEGHINDAHQHGCDKSLSGWDKSHLAGCDKSQLDRPDDRTPYENQSKHNTSNMNNRSNYNRAPSKALGIIFVVPQTLPGACRTLPTSNVARLHVHLRNPS